MGVCAVILRSRLADLSVGWNYRLLGVRFNRRYYEAGFTVGGLGMIILALLTLIRSTE